MTQAPLRPLEEDLDDVRRRARIRAIIAISSAHAQDRAVATLELELAARHGHAIVGSVAEDGSREVIGLSAGRREVLTVEPNGVLRGSSIEVA